MKVASDVTSGVIVAVVRSGVASRVSTGDGDGFLGFEVVVDGADVGWLVGWG